MAGSRHRPLTHKAPDGAHEPLHLGPGVARIGQKHRHPQVAAQRHPDEGGMDARPCAAGQNGSVSLGLRLVEQGVKLLNYNYWHMLVDMTLSLIGTLIFSVLSCATAISLVRRGVETARRNPELEQRAHIMQPRDTSQHEQYRLVQQLDSEVGRQRHERQGL